VAKEAEREAMQQSWVDVGVRHRGVWRADELW
jgi:hypothetical protein